MKPFMDEHFLLETDTARTLYHTYAKKLPIIDYHCHINPQEIAENKQYASITELWLGGDHYKWRAMRAMGVPERYITGDAPPEEKFQKWAETMPALIGNPLYHWTHLELQRYFGITQPLTGENAKELYHACNEALKRPDMRVRGIIAQSNVETICTTDDPLDTLQAHARLADDFAVQVLPAFRPDKAMNIQLDTFPAYIHALEEVLGYAINSFCALQRALSDRIDYFARHGCRVSDHALTHCIYREAGAKELERIFQAGLAQASLSAADIEAFQTAVLLHLAGAYRERGWVMQLHFGCIRNNSDRLFASLGPDTGFDCMNDASGLPQLARMLNALEKTNALPKTILYSLNPNDSEAIASIMGCFQTDAPLPGRIQLGSAWWFNDHKRGMEKQLNDLASLGALGAFVGMLTDSRSFLSYTRHEYFRRILCNQIGNWVEQGEYPNDSAALQALVENICYYNARRYFEFTA